MRAAPTDRQALIETAAHRLAQDALEAGAAWAKRLGQPPTQPRARAQWHAHAATIALYRHRYDVTGVSPIGDAKTVNTTEQATEYRAAQTALARAKRVATSSNDIRQERSDLRVAQVSRL